MSFCLHEIITEWFGRHLGDQKWIEFPRYSQQRCRNILKLRIIAEDAQCALTDR